MAKLDLYQEYIFTDAVDYIPYFMLASIKNIGIGEPNFYSFSKYDSSHQGWGQRISYIIRSYSFQTSYFHRSNMKRASRGAHKLYANSLFMMNAINDKNPNILLCGVVKEQDAQDVKALLNQNDINVGGRAYEKLAPYLEVWIADNFDVTKSVYHYQRLLYRRNIRRYLIGSGLRIIVKPASVMNNLLINRKPSFETIDAMQNKIKQLCQTM